MHLLRLQIHVAVWHVSVFAGTMSNGQAAKRAAEMSLFEFDMFEDDILFAVTADDQCGIQEGFDPTSGEANLFVRDSPECLPPVNIGADTLQLFEDPLTLLENLPLSTDDDFSGSGLPPPQSPGPSDPISPGLLPKEQQDRLWTADERRAFEKEMAEQGWVDMPPVPRPVRDIDPACDPEVLGGIYEEYLCCGGQVWINRSFVRNHWKYEKVETCLPCMCVTSASCP